MAIYRLAQDGRIKRGPLYQAKLRYCMGTTLDLKAWDIMSESPLMMKAFFAPCFFVFGAGKSFFCFMHSFVPPKTFLQDFLLLCYV